MKRLNIGIFGSLKTPPHIDISPEAMLAAAHGVSPEEKCPSCGRPYSRHHGWRCICGRPLPTRCPICGSAVHPFQDAATGVWYEATVPCCSDTEAIQGRARDSIRRVIPEDLLEAANPELFRKHEPAQAAAQGIVRTWLRERCRKSLWLYGPGQCGKSTIAAYAMSQAVLRGHVSRPAWVTWYDLLEARKSFWSDVPSDDLREYMSAGVLVVDDMCIHGYDRSRAIPVPMGATRKACFELGQGFLRRLEANEPTICVSTVGPVWSHACWANPKLEGTWKRRALSAVIKETTA